MYNQSQRLAFASRLLRHIPPDTKGKHRLARFMCGSSLDLRDIALNTGEGDGLIVPSVREPVGFGLLIDGGYEHTTLNFLRDQLAPGRVFVDVGANVGAFAIPIARLVGPDGRVLAVEASPKVFPYLTRNIDRNHLSQVTAVHCAAHDHDADQVSFWDPPADHFGMGALTAQFGVRATSITLPDSGPADRRQGRDSCGRSEGGC